MARVIVLGSAAAVSDAGHDNTHFVIEGENGAILVDCGSNPMGKLHRLGLDDAHMQDVILTHFHPDHVAGFPNMIMQMWLLGRQSPMRIFGLAHCMTRTEEMMKAFAWTEWPNFFPVTFHRVPEHDAMLVLNNADFEIKAWPTRHFIPTIGLRVTNKRTGKVLAYSCDTEPIPALHDLGRDADIFIHEAAGAGFGHSSARQAGEVATTAGAKALYLIHYQVWNADPTPLVAEAQATFSGEVRRLVDGDVFEF